MEFNPQISPNTTFYDKPRPMKGTESRVSRSEKLTPIRRGRDYGLVETPTTPRVIQGRLFHHSLLPLQRQVERSDNSQRQQELCMTNTSGLLCKALFPNRDGPPPPQAIPDIGIFSSVVFPSTASKPSSPLLSSMAPTADFKGTLNSLPKITSPYFSASESKITLPRKFRMRDELGDIVARKPSPKKRKIKLHLSDVAEPAFMPVLTNVCLNISSWRLGSLHSVTQSYVSISCAQIEINQCVRVQASELITCEMCLDQKLPVIFLQTTPAGSLRLRVQLNMSRKKSSVWYDCGASASPSEKYIVLMLEKLPLVHHQNALEKILSGIGRENQLNKFPRKISLDEAKNKLIAQDKEAQSLPFSPQSEEHVLSVLVTDEEDLLDAGGNGLTVTLTDPVRRLLVYPPPPAKGGIAVTNEDLSRLKEGEFLNDVVIDFYLKFLMLEKLKREDAERTHIFSTFFFRHLTQGRQKRDGTNAKEPLKKRRHDRVKTWTRHVDLFEKDFVFVPINKSAHWFLAIVCFPGRCRPDVGSQPTANTQEDQSPQEPCQSDCLETRFFWRTGQDFSYSPNPLSLFYKPTDSTTRVDKWNTGAADAISFEDEEDLEMEIEQLEYTENVPKPCNTEEPCILIMDSLGSGRSTVVNTLKEYLEEEWRARKGSQCTFEIKGFSPSVPQQNNSSDCGIYLLQYVESFFESPLQSFKAPIDLNKWFPQSRVSKKRKEITELILNIQSEQQMAEIVKDG